VGITPKYIKQCEKAEKIQEEWTPTYGDYWVFRHSDYWGGYGIFYGQHLGKDLKSSAIFLPRQDQLQEMVSPSFLNEDNFIFIDRFLSFIDSSNRGWSLEQLWLAFVMRERYQKRWDDEKEEWRKF